VTGEGMITYGGVGASCSAPKWLLRAMEILKSKQRKSKTEFRSYPCAVRK